MTFSKHVNKVCESLTPAHTNHICICKSTEKHTHMWFCTCSNTQASTKQPSCMPVYTHIYEFSSVQFGCSVMSSSLWPHGPQHTRLSCPSPAPRSCSNSCSSSWFCHPPISSSVAPFSSCPQSFSASGSFQMSHFFTSCGQSIRASASASVLLMNIQDWFPLGLTGWISLQSQELSRVFFNTIVQKHQLFSAQLSL